MARYLHPTRLALMLLLSANLPAAHAVDGTITINGEITETTCKINGNAPPKNVIVNLPKISTTALKNKGDTAGATLFTLELTDCPESLSGTVKAYFEPGITTDYSSGDLYAYTYSASIDTTSSSTTGTAIPSRSSATKASNVEIQLANTDGTAIKVGDDASKAKGATLVAADSKKKATLRYLARYIKSGDGTVTTGKLVTYVQYSIVYP
ncbi:fimbrial protein [Bordetella trematum]|uniref:fimbrial protein n=1 Tax=Bordetella trematum TaxID=123899 RepID=UPI0015C523B2|nr:fimbrial protein [Bordetella trematum]